MHHTMYYAVGILRVISVAIAVSSSCRACGQRFGGFGLFGRRRESSFSIPLLAAVKGRKVWVFEAAKVVLQCGECVCCTLIQGWV